MNTVNQNQAITISTIANAVALTSGVVNNLAGEDIAQPANANDLYHDVAYELTKQLDGEV